MRVFYHKKRADAAILGSPTSPKKRLLDCIIGRRDGFLALCRGRSSYCFQLSGICLIIHSMKIVCIADTHEKHKQVKLPKGDILIHAGDLTWVGAPRPTLEFLDWFEAQPFVHKILVSGNHDFYFEHGKNLELLKGRNFHYLMNNKILIDGHVKIWGSPFTPEFLDWAFMGTPSKMETIWAKIPNGLDILITHGPPFGILDRTTDGANAGCPKLLEIVQARKPKIHIFGHIHEGYGMREINGTVFINASLCNANYDLVNKPVVFNL